MVDMSAQHQHEPLAKKARYLSIVEDDTSSVSDDDTTGSWSDHNSHDQRRDSHAKKEGTGGSSSHKIESFLQFASRQLGGLNLSLNDHGCCAFRYDGITIVSDVPDERRAFCFYTRNLVAEAANPTQEQLLYLNSNGKWAIAAILLASYFLHQGPELTVLFVVLSLFTTTGYARNGLLSTKKHDDGSEEVIFSYVDVVDELSAQSFLYIIINFVETAASLRSKLLLLMTLKQGQQDISPAFCSDVNVIPTKSRPRPI